MPSPKYYLNNLLCSDRQTKKKKGDKRENILLVNKKIFKDYVIDLLQLKQVFSLFDESE